MQVEINSLNREVRVSQNGVPNDAHRLASFALDLIAPGPMTTTDRAIEGAVTPLAADVSTVVAGNLLRCAGVEVTYGNPA